MLRFLLFSSIGLVFSFGVQAQSLSPAPHAASDTPASSEKTDEITSHEAETKTDNHAENDKAKKRDRPSSKEDLDDYFSKAEDEAVLGSMCEPPEEPTV